ncbi:uncharacterized protein VP01_3472g1 [Puccinia sorghi]|uniref:Uncharacterized protein n=1 Tax=Puccinia sorghi TaxID=27349 RepID=A0A0L6UW06_9BASI|nr:uncharacterized protein VP01_3472g1 [Puccinia sorghi]
MGQNSFAWKNKTTIEHRALNFFATLHFDNSVSNVTFMEYVTSPHVEHLILADNKHIFLLDLLGIHVAFLIRVASSQTGAEKLIDAKLLVQLGQCNYLRSSPQSLSLFPKI